MNSTLFTTEHVSTERIMYTPSSFAKESLLHIQETGWLKALTPHISKRSSLSSYLLFIVTEGSGDFCYENIMYTVKAGDCVFIDCSKEYFHRTSSDLWTLKWVHFYGPTMPSIYNKYKERGGLPVFTPNSLTRYYDLLDELYTIGNSSDYVRDMKICERLVSLLSCLMEDCYSSENNALPAKKKSISDITDYLDRNFKEKISLDELSLKFYVNKFYLTRIFKAQTGMSITDYLLTKRITYAKTLLRYSEDSLEEIGEKCGISDAGYFSKTFKKVEGITPGEYRKTWRN